MQLLHKMMIDKRDIVTILVLSIVFLSMATWSLGATQIPQTTAYVSDGHSFYIDLGVDTSISSVYILLKNGHFNVTTSVWINDNWQTISYNVAKPYSNNDWGIDYYKYHEISINRVTRYINFDFTYAYSSGEIAEIVVIDTNYQQVLVSSIENSDSTLSNVHNLIDEQDIVHLPITYMSQTYFDEIYFVKTAEQYLHLQSPYEWTHPPLGKLIQAAGITVFGLNPFGWRIAGVLFAALMIPVIYLIGKRLFGTWIGAFAPSFLLTFDFMHFTMGRMGTVDTYVVFFLLLSQLCFLVYFMNVFKKGWATPILPLFLAIMFFILSFSTKWIAMYPAIGMLALLVVLRVKDVSKLKESILQKYAAFFDHPFMMLLGFIVIAVGIYFAIYIPDLMTGRPIYWGDGRGVIDLQFAMYNYHALLVAEHDFTSAWWSWPLLVSNQGYVPLWLAVNNLPNAMKSTIAVFGNPAVWWTGFVCIFFTIYRALRGKEVAAIFISTIFLFSWLPYVFISRLTFIYHFYIAVPFLCLAAGYVINRYWHSKWCKIATLVFFIVVVVVFAIFYNVTSGVPATVEWINKLKLFPSWYF
jgi:dolichyl-phosphate-mannose-protein mannosyltransferase